MKRVVSPDLEVSIPTCVQQSHFTLFQFLSDATGSPWTPVRKQTRSPLGTDSETQPSGTLQTPQDTNSHSSIEANGASNRIPYRLRLVFYRLEFGFGDGPRCEIVRGSLDATTSPLSRPTQPRYYADLQLQPSGDNVSLDPMTVTSKVVQKDEKLKKEQRIEQMVEQTQSKKLTSVQCRDESGCLTCRARHLKCDEGRPVCKDCAMSRRECLWYQAPAHQAATPADTLTPNDLHHMRAALEYLHAYIGRNSSQANGQGQTDCIPSDSCAENSELEHVPANPTAAPAIIVVPPDQPASYSYQHYPVSKTGAEHGTESHMSSMFLRNNVWLENPSEDIIWSDISPTMDDPNDLPLQAYKSTSLSQVNGQGQNRLILSPSHAERSELKSVPATSLHCPLHDTSPESSLHSLESIRSDREMSFVQYTASTDVQSDKLHLNTQTPSFAEIIATFLYQHSLRFINGEVETINQPGHAIEQDAPEGKDRPSQKRSRSSTGNLATYETGLGDSSKKRRKQPRKKNDEDNDESATPPVRRSKTHSESSLEIFLACPYYKANPLRYSRRSGCDCGSKKLRSIPTLKQHLYRVHGRPDYYCAKCCKEFDNRAFRDEHIRSVDCQMVEDIYADKMEPEMCEKIKQRNQRNRIELWYDIFEILFPGRQRPNSPYADDQESIMHFVNMFVRLGRRLVVDLVRNLGQAGESTAQIPQPTQAILDEALDIFNQMHQDRTSSIGVFPSQPPAITEVRQTARNPTTSFNTYPSPCTRVSSANLGRQYTDTLSDQNVNHTRHEVDSFPHNFSVGPLTDPLGNLDATESMVRSRSSDIPDFATLGEDWATAFDDLAEDILPQG